jgi:hypothetical protein
VIANGSLLSLNSEVENLRLRANSVAQAFQPAGSPDFPGRHRGDWKVAPTRRQECLRYVTIPSRSLANFGIQA